MCILNKFGTFYEYEVLLCRGILLPLLQRMGISLNGRRVLDVGCGAGGLLLGLAEYFKFDGLGIDYDEDMISKCRAAPGVRFERGDYLTYDFKDRFDFIILRDVLEHCSATSEMLGRTAALLSANGLTYVTYTPYLSPFGGHQHNGSGFFSFLPYIHYLPELIFLRLIRPISNTYKTRKYLWQDLIEIRKAGVTTGKVKVLCRHYGLNILYKNVFLIRPDYKYKFGLTPIAMPASLPMTSLLDPFCTSVELILGKQNSKK